MSILVLGQTGLLIVHIHIDFTQLQYTNVILTKIYKIIIAWKSLSKGVVLYALFLDKTNNTKTKKDNFKSRP